MRNDASFGYDLLLSEGMPTATQDPKALCEILKVFQKDQGRARFQVLARKPTPDEKRDHVASKFIMGNGDYKGMLMIRIRCVQGQSVQFDDRTGQRIVSLLDYPMLRFSCERV